MTEILSNPYHEILRFDRGDDVVAGILEFVEKKEIVSAWLWALGAAQKAELGFYDPEARQYNKKMFDEPMEILQMTGNIVSGDDGPALHLHGSFGRPDYSVIGGHVHALTAHGTVEVFIHKIPGSVRRTRDEKSGLDLLSAI